MKCWWLLHKISLTSHRHQRTFISTTLQGTELIKTKSFYLTSVVPKVMECLYDTQINGDVLPHLCNSPWLVHFWQYCTSFHMPLWWSLFQQSTIKYTGSCHSHDLLKVPHMVEVQTALNFSMASNVIRAVWGSTLSCWKLKYQFIKNLSQSANWQCL
jgi:hypothetical protein